MVDGIRDIIKVSSWLRKRWEKPSTLAVLLIAGFILSLWLSYQVDLANFRKAFSAQELIGTFLFLIVLTIIWYVSRKPPVTQKDKIGVAIAINCETKKERQRLKADFINALRNEIRRGNHQHFHVFELSEYHSEQIDTRDRVIQYQKATGAHLLLYGRCRIRTHEGKSTYVLDLQARVIHLTIPPKVSAQLGLDMRRVFPGRILIPESEELMGFQLTQDIVRDAARYTLGVASLLSLDAITAFDLHHGLWLQMKQVTETDGDILVGHKHIKNKLPNLLVTEGIGCARHFYVMKPTNYLTEVKKYIDVVQEIDPQNYQAHLLRGVHYFLGDHDIDKAKQEIRKARNERDSTWQFSAAFLEAYEGNLEQAHKIYRRAFKGIVQDDIPIEVEIFINDVLEGEPDKVQLWYCLGMINYFCKGDLQSARRDFARFIELAAPIREFSTSVGFAQKYLDEIDKRKS